MEQKTEALKRMNLPDEAVRQLQALAGSDEAMQAIQYNDAVVRVMGKCQRLDKILQKLGLQPAALESSKQVIKPLSLKPISELMETALQIEDFLDCVLSGYEHEMKKNRKSFIEKISEKN